MRYAGVINYGSKELTKKTIDSIGKIKRCIQKKGQKAMKKVTACLCPLPFKQGYVGQNYDLIHLLIIRICVMQSCTNLVLFALQFHFFIYTCIFSLKIGIKP